MKELSIEQKAKRYDEALERASKLRVQNPFDTVSQMMEHVFPELGESEDEKMMNQLHSWMKEFGGAEEYTEKVYQWIKGLLEKQGEQKPAWSEEDIKKIDTIIGYIASSAGEKIGVLLPCIDWLKSLKERVQSQPKQEWSEEDEKVIHCLEYTVRHFYEDEESGRCYVVENKDW